MNISTSILASYSFLFLRLISTLNNATGNPQKILGITMSERPNDFTSGPQMTKLPQDLVGYLVFASKYFQADQIYLLRRLLLRFHWPLWFYQVEFQSLVAEWFLKHKKINHVNLPLVVSVVQIFNDNNLMASQLVISVPKTEPMALDLSGTSLSSSSL